MSDTKHQILTTLAAAMPAAKARFDQTTGRFLDEPDGPIAPGAKPEDIGWTVTSQDIIYPLAVLYTEPGTNCCGDPAILDMALRGGDAIRDFQYPDGQVEFLKVDGSRWGATYMGWTNYAWLEAYDVLRDILDPERRHRWEEGLTLAHDGQARELEGSEIYNIPCWKAMSCYRAGQVFDRPDWQDAAVPMLHQVAEAQLPDGFWMENGGPSTLYNTIYLHGLGLYYRFSGDAHVLPALEAATAFNQTFIYPDGLPVETVDGRVKYEPRIRPFGWVGYSISPRGRRLVRHIVEQMSKRDDFKDYQGGAIASSIRHLFPGDEAPITLDQQTFRETFRGWAIVAQDAPWFACLSAYTSEPVATRWGLDRQAFISLWHHRHGLFFGGGNSKDQPEWSTFIADGRILPDRGELLPDAAGVVLHYGRVACTLQLTFDKGTATITASAEGGPALQQVVIQTKAGDTLRTASGLETTLGDGAIYWTKPAMGDWLEVKGCRITLPHNAEFRWPTVPFNPYSADGSPAFGSEVGTLTVRLDQEPATWQIQG